MANEKIYDVIFDKVFQDAKEGLEQNVFFKADETKFGVDMLSFGDYINDLQQQYEERGFFANDTAENREVLNTAYSSVRTLRAMCNMCAAQQIKDSLGNLFQDTSNNNEWFEENGLGNVDKAELYKLMNEYVDNKIESINVSQGIQDLSQSLKDQFTNSSRGMKGFLQSGFEYVYTLNKQLLDGATPEDAKYLNTPDADVMKKVFNREFLVNIATAVSDHADNFQDRVPNEANWFESNSYSSDNSINVRIAFDKDKTVNPHEFLQRFNENNLTDADKEWADKIFMDIESEYQASEIGKSKGNTIYSDYKANGSSIITADDLTKLNNNELTHQDISSKIVASMLSGDSVTIQKDNSKESTYINPSIHNDNEKSTGLARIFEVIWEAILSAVHKTSDRQKINEQINEMNDKYEKNNTSERVKMSFNSLIEKSKDNNRQTTRNTNAKVKTNEKANELATPTKKR